MIGTITQKRQARALIDVLEFEHRCLVTGAFDDLQEATERKSKLVSALEQVEDGAPDLAGLMEKVRFLATRNRKVIEASMAGMAAAGRRLTEIDSARSSLGTYTGKGQRVDITLPQGRTLEKRS